VLEVRRHIRKERGSVLILAAVLLVVLIGMAALAVDLGWLRLGDARAQDVCDAVALGTAWLLEPTDVAATAERMSTAADALAIANNETDNRKLLKPGTDTPGVTVTSVLGKSVTLEGEVKVNFGFARIFGPEDKFKAARVKASSTAILESNKGFSYRFVPLAITKGLAGRYTPNPVTQNQRLFTKLWDMVTGAPDPGNPSNLYPVELPGQSDYEDLLTGDKAPFTLKVGDRVTEIPADRSNETVDSLSRRISGDGSEWMTWEAAGDVEKAASKRILILPVVYGTSGSRAWEIVGFAGFFVENVSFYYNLSEHGADLRGHFVPGVVGAQSIHWLLPYEGTDVMASPFASERGNLMYRVRLKK
jgi:hypothetical protein